MICLESIHTLKRNLTYFTRMSVLEDIEEEGTDEL